MEHPVLLAIYQIVTPVLLAVIAFWLSRFVKKVDRLEELLRKMELAFSSQNASCVEKHKGINARLNGHDHEIDILKNTTGHHTTEIEVIKNKLKVN
ncbi:MAG: hypothetical protein AB9842_08165 [Bacteroidales bacterium]